MKKPCKECPWLVKTKNNDTIIEFSERMSMKHNCHMTEAGKKNLWKVEEDFECIGKKFKSSEK